MQVQLELQFGSIQEPIIKNSVVTELGSPLEKRALMTFLCEKFGREFRDFFFSVSATVFGFEIAVRCEDKRSEAELALAAVWF